MRTLVCIFILTCNFGIEVTAVIKNTVIDLSHHNGKVNFSKIKEAGIELVIHKATQGTRFVDPNYNTNKQQAEKMGFMWAAYHFADGSDGKTQATHFMNNVGKIYGRAVPLVVDLETNPKGTTVRKKQAEDLVATIKNSTGANPIVYGSQSFLDSLDSEVLAQCSLWVASYRASKPKMPKRWNDWFMWQYTDGSAGPGPHTVEGVGKVDRSFIKN